jgi:hypothetical protein
MEAKKQKTRGGEILTSTLQLAECDLKLALEDGQIKKLEQEQNPTIYSD